jgi:hypothetical protein
MVFTRNTLSNGFSQKLLVGKTDIVYLSLEFASASVSRSYNSENSINHKISIIFIHIE